MRKSRNPAVALLLSALIAASPRCGAQAVNCRSCHVPGGAPGAADFTEMYAFPEKHHRIGMEYPLGRQDFRLPDGQDIDGPYFEKNFNGIADIDEVQMFDAPPHAGLIECATCHMEHGYGPPVPGHPEKYLRFKNIGSSLCTTCHIM